MDDRSYYARRALQEQEAAGNAACAAARDCHAALAAAYAVRGGFAHAADEAGPAAAAGSARAEARS